MAPTTTAPPATPAPTTGAPADSADPLASAPSYVQSAFSCITWRESRDEPTAVNPTSGDGGLYQFNVGTWLAHGGGQFASEAQYASVTQQDTVAFWTWQADGFSPWTGDNSCWQ